VLVCGSTPAEPVGCVRAGLSLSLGLGLEGVGGDGRGRGTSWICYSSKSAYSSAYSSSCSSSYSSVGSCSSHSISSTL
jgi:hypothetical protein